MSKGYIGTIAFRYFHTLSKEERCKVALQGLREELDATASVQPNANAFRTLKEVIEASIEVSMRFHARDQVLTLLQNFVQCFSSDDKNKPSCIWNVRDQWPEFLDELFHFWHPTLPIASDKGGYEIFLILYNGIREYDIASWRSILCDSISRALDKKSLDGKELFALEEWILDPRTPVEFQRVMRRIHAKNEPLEIFIERIKAKHVALPEKQ